MSRLFCVMQEKKGTKTRCKVLFRWLLASFFRRSGAVQKALIQRKPGAEQLRYDKKLMFSAFW